MLPLTRTSAHMGLFALALLALGIVPWADGEEELPLPSFDEAPRFNRFEVGESATKWLTPSVVVTPPPLTEEQKKKAELAKADFRPWRIFEGSTTPAQVEPIPTPPKPTLRALMVLPGFRDKEQDDGLEAYAASVPVPPKIQGVRDFGAELSPGTVKSLKALIGEPLDDALVPQIREMIILGFATEKRTLDGILVPEVGEASGILKVVVMEAIGEAAVAAKKPTPPDSKPTG